jgi:hypothetical protein
MAGAKKSPFAIRMDEIQARIDPRLKQLGFRKSGRSYNRETDPGIVQVINFQMAAYEPPVAGVPPVPAWLKPDLYGQFAVNLGIFVTEIASAQNLKARAKFILAPGCALRVRLGRLIGPTGKEIWWRLDQPIDAVVQDVESALFAKGMIFLERFATRQAIISDWVKFNDTEMHLTNIARLDVGIMLAATGDKKSASGLFREHLARPSQNSRHHLYVKELGEKLGLEL